MTPVLYKSIKSKLHKNFVRNFTLENKIKFNKFSNKLKSIRKTAERSYCSDKFTKYDNKESIANYINR